LFSLRHIAGGNVGRKRPGDDTGVDAGPLDEPRMYQLVRVQGDIRPRTCEITFQDPGARAFVFTFG